jgi:hypothetical protein
LGPLLRHWENEPLNLTEGRGSRGVGMRNYLDEEEFSSILHELMSRFLSPMAAGLRPGELFIDKTPDHALFMDEIYRMLPRCRFIHVLRDGRDVTASFLAVSRDWGREWAPNSSRKAARRWVKYVEAVRESSKKLSPGQFLEVRYESLLENPEKELEKVARYLGLEWSTGEIEKAILQNNAKAPQEGWTPIPRRGDFLKRAGPVVKEPAHFARKATSGNWKKDLGWRDKIWFWMVARKTMKEVGYECKYPW